MMAVLFMLLMYYFRNTLSSGVRLASHAALPYKNNPTGGLAADPVGSNWRLHTTVETQRVKAGQNHGT